MNQAADELLQSMGVSHFDAKTEVDALSFEERKLIEVCRAMYNDPDILIVDETTTALSHTGREKFIRLSKISRSSRKRWYLFPMIWMRCRRCAIQR